MERSHSPVMRLLLISAVTAAACRFTSTAIAEDVISNRAEHSIGSAQ
jgi:hypothetical protein